MTLMVIMKMMIMKETMMKIMIMKKTMMMMMIMKKTMMKIMMSMMMTTKDMYGRRSMLFVKNNTFKRKVVQSPKVDFSVETFFVSSIVLSYVSMCLSQAVLFVLRVIGVCTTPM